MRNTLFSASVSVYFKHLLLEGTFLRPHASMTHIALAPVLPRTATTASADPVPLGAVPFCCSAFSLPRAAVASLVSFPKHGFPLVGPGVAGSWPTASYGVADLRCDCQREGRGKAPFIKSNALNTYVLCKVHCCLICFSRALLVNGPKSLLELLR